MKRNTTNISKAQKQASERLDSYNDIKEQEYAELREMSPAESIRHGLLLIAEVAKLKATNNDFEKLQALSDSCSEAMTALFLKNSALLPRPTFVKATAALRVLNKIEERERNRASSAQPYFAHPEILLYFAMLSSVLTAFREGRTTPSASPSLRILVNGLFGLAQERFQDAVTRGLLKTEAEADFWSPRWQKGEVEAEIDESLGHVKHFTSVGSLINDLRGTAGSQTPSP